MLTKEPTKIHGAGDALIDAQPGMIVLIPILENFRDETRHFTTAEFIIREVYYDGLVTVQHIDDPLTLRTEQPGIDVLGDYCTLKSAALANQQALQEASL